MKKLFIFIAATFLLLPACGGFMFKGEKSADELAEKGMQLFRKERYNPAIEVFTQLRDLHPYSRLAVLAHLKIADAHYQLEHYTQALYEYGEFEKLHPSHPEIDRVHYRIARCHFDQVKTVDRDQTATRDALAALLKFTNQFPDSDYMEATREHIKQCYQMLAGHDFYVGRFYFKSGHYAAALKRFQAVIGDYPEVGYHDKARDYIERCRKKLDRRQDQAAPVEAS